MAITVRVNLAVIAAAVIGELVSTAWQSDAFPWGRYEDHYLITSLVADFILAVILEWITRYVQAYNYRGHRGNSLPQIYLYTYYICPHLETVPILPRTVVLLISYNTVHVTICSLNYLIRGSPRSFMCIDEECCQVRSPWNRHGCHGQSWEEKVSWAHQMSELNKSEWVTYGHVTRWPKISLSIKIPRIYSIYY